MPIGENEAIEVSVLSGQTAQASVFLHQGKTTNPASVGTAGEWTIVADGVAPVHVFFAFDGNDVFVASAPDVIAVLAGTPLGTQWTKASIPCELRFAGACLVMRKVPKERAYNQPEGLASTMGDGGALLKAAQRAVEVAMRAQQGRPPSFESTAVMPGGARLVLPSPADVSPPSTLRMSDRPLSPLGEKRPGAPVLLDMPGDGKAAPAGGDAPDAKKDGELKAYWKSASPVKRASLVLMPFAMALSYWMLQPAPPPPPPNLIASAATAHPAPSAATVGSTARASTASSASAAAPAAAAPSTSAAASSSSAAASSASAAASSAPLVPAMPASAKAAKPAYAAKLAPGKRTPDREAIDAVASGSFDDAEKRYDALSAAHPDIVAYKEAARVLADKSGHAR